MCTFSAGKRYGIPQHTVNISYREKYGISVFPEPFLCHNRVPTVPKKRARAADTSRSTSIPSGHARVHEELGYNMQQTFLFSFSEGGGDVYSSSSQVFNQTGLVDFSALQLKLSYHTTSIHSAAVHHKICPTASPNNADTPAYVQYIPPREPFHPFIPQGPLTTRVALGRPLAHHPNRTSNLSQFTPKPYRDGRV